MSPHPTLQFFKRCAFGVAALCGCVGSYAQTTNVPEAVHIICIAEDAKAFGLTLGLNDVDTADFRDVLLTLIGDGKLTKDQDRRFKEVMRRHVWPLQGLWARSLGTGFVVGADSKTVLTSYAVASQCPLDAGQDQSERRQIAVLTKDGLRPIRASALGINHTNGALGTPLPKFLCKKEGKDGAPCSTKLAAELQKDQLAGGKGLAQLRDGVKYWVPDLTVLNLDEAIDLKPVFFRPDDQIAVGSSLQYSGFPRSQQIAGMGVANTVLPAQRAKPTVQPATFSRVIDYDNSKSDLIVSPDRKVVAKWFELSGTGVEYGNSGAPLFDPGNGQIVGMVINDLEADGSQGGGKAVPAKQIQEYLTKANVKFNVASIPQVPAPAVSSAASAPTVPTQEVDTGWRDRLLSPNMYTLSIAALIAAFLGMIAWLVWRQRQPVEAELKPFDINAPSYKGGHTKPQYYVSLRCTHGPLATREFILPTANGKDSLTLGKDPGMCQVVFPETLTEISGMHCGFTYDAATHSVFVEDKNSTNGTFVNKRRLNKGERVRLHNNDIVGLARPDTNIFMVSIH
jgi:hypothetical protein